MSNYTMVSLEDLQEIKKFQQGLKGELAAARKIIRKQRQALERVAFDERAQSKGLVFQQIARKAL